MAELSPLRRRMIEDMAARNMSPATQRSYISAVSKFSRIFWQVARAAGSGRRSRFPGSPWSRRASRGPVSTRSFAPCGSSMASRSATQTFPTYPLCARAA